MLLDLKHSETKWLEQPGSCGKLLIVPNSRRLLLRRQQVRQHGYTLAKQCSVSGKVFDRLFWYGNTLGRQSLWECGFGLITYIFWLLDEITLISRWSWSNKSDAWLDGWFRSSCCMLRRHCSSASSRIGAGRKAISPLMWGEALHGVMSPRSPALDPLQYKIR